MIQRLVLGNCEWSSVGVRCDELPNVLETSCDQDFAYVGGDKNEPNRV